MVQWEELLSTTSVMSLNYDTVVKPCCYTDARCTGAQKEANIVKDPAVRQEIVLLNMR